jgi:hypothetical protein
LDIKRGWSEFWVIFSQTHLVTLVVAQNDTDAEIECEVNLCEPIATKLWTPIA